MNQPCYIDTVSTLINFHETQKHFQGLEELAKELLDLFFGIIRRLGHEMLNGLMDIESFKRNYHHLEMQSVIALDDPYCYFSAGTIRYYLRRREGTDGTISMQFMKGIYHCDNF